MRIDKDNIKIILILLILGLGIGYSYLNTDLAINGTANINSANWNVYWNNVQVTDGSVEAATPTISNKTTVSFDVTLAEPGDYYEFTVDAVNAGTLDAMIDTMDSKLNGVTIEELPAYLDYGVTYADDTTIDVDQLLLHDSTETYKIRIAYADYIEASDLPDTNQSLSLEFSVTYKQADDNAQPVDHGTTIYTTSSDVVTIGEALPSTLTYYSTPEEAVAAYGHDFCLKHIIKNGVVSESYVVFIISQATVTEFNGELVAGKYELRGLNTDDENSSSTGYCKMEYYDAKTGVCMSPYYEHNKEILYEMFNHSSCEESLIDTDVKYYHYRCIARGTDGNTYTAYADSNGETDPKLVTKCSIHFDGTSNCVN